MSFTYEEQWTMDIAWYGLDANGKIGHFTTGGEKMLPRNVAESKETLKKLNDFFENLQVNHKDNFLICPDIKNKLNERLVLNMGGYVTNWAQMSSKGLYTFDSPIEFDENRPYYRLTIPKRELNVEELPTEIKTILKNFTLRAADFVHDSTITNNMI